MIRSSAQGYPAFRLIAATTTDCTRHIWCRGCCSRLWLVLGHRSRAEEDLERQIWRSLGKCLDVSNGDTAAGTTVQLYTCNGTAA